mmetsp:Transcript_28022/g.65147  ORF Transcript_28022/g.65147 Transcript_28022/m.65147 type:complete len:464 (+) Transcript_28022:520-1911(+)
MNSGHETFLQAKFIIDDLGHWGQAVCGTRSIGDNIHGGFILFVVHSHDKHGGIRGRSRDDNLLGSTGQVLGGSFCLGKDTSRFNNIVGSGISPLDVGRVHFSKDRNGLVVKHDGLFIMNTNSARVLSVGGVKFHHVFHVVDRNKGVVDSDNVDHGVVLSGTHDETTNAAKSIDTDVDRLQCGGGVLAVDNVSKFGLQRSSTNEETINIRLGGQSWGGLGVGGSTVEDTSVFGNVSASNLTQVFTNGSVCVLGLFRGCSETSSNGPNGFVGNNNVFPVLLVKDVSVGLDLREDKIVGGSSFSAFQRFTTACNDLEALVESVLGLGGNFGVGFSLSTTFGVTHQGPLDTHVGQHIGRGFSSKGAISLCPHILGTNRDITTDSRLDRLKVDLGWANDNFRVLAQGRLVEHGNEFFRFGNAAIAFPVTTDKEFAGFGSGRGVEATSRDFLCESGSCARREHGQTVVL